VCVRPVSAAPRVPRVVSAVRATYHEGGSGRRRIRRVKVKHVVFHVQAPGRAPWGERKRREKGERRCTETKRLRRCSHVLEDIVVNRQRKW
jgi:hypothetical protein